MRLRSRAVKPKRIAVPSAIEDAIAPLPPAARIRASRTLLELTGSGTLAKGVRLPTRSATHVTVRTAARRYHRNGKLIELSRRPSEWVVTIDPAAVEYLLCGG